MKVAIDATVLAYFFDAEAAPPLDASGVPVALCRERITLLISELQKAKATIIIPAPALSEILVYAGDAAPNWLSVLSNTKYCRIADFDQLAAVECAVMAKRRIEAGPRREGYTKRKVKFDEQIVAIALVEQADEILSDDSDIRALAGDRMLVRGIGELPVPAQDLQISIDWNAAGDRPSQDLDITAD